MSAGGEDLPVDARRAADDGRGGAGGLPFTGLDLWAMTLLGLAGVVAGLALRRRAREGS